MGETITFKLCDDNNAEAMLIDKKEYICTNWILLVPIGLLIIVVGFIISGTYYNSFSMWTHGFTLACFGGIVLFFGIGYGNKGVDAYELYSGYGSRVIIKTTPEQDQIEICKAKTELENNLKLYKSKSKEEKDRLQALIDNCK